MKQTWAAPERNKGPILGVLQRVLHRPGTVLEVASGSGQHAAHFAAHLPHLRWQPTDMDLDNLASIRAWVESADLPNLLAPRELDVRSPDWGVTVADTIFCANMIHIAPWDCTLDLLAGAARHLASQGLLLIYGPFKLHGSHTAQSNASFDEGLRARNPAWGVRDVDDVVNAASQRRLTLVERIAMPANNQTLVLRHR